MGSIFKFPQGSPSRAPDIAAATAFLLSEKCERFEHSISVEIVSANDSHPHDGRIEIEADICLGISVTDRPSGSLYISISPANALAFASALQTAAHCVASNRTGAGLE